MRRNYIKGCSRLSKDCSRYSEAHWLRRFFKRYRRCDISVIFVLNFSNARLSFPSIASDTLLDVNYCIARKNSKFLHSEETSSYYCLTVTHACSVTGISSQLPHPHKILTSLSLRFLHQTLQVHDWIMARETFKRQTSFVISVECFIEFYTLLNF